MALATYAAEVLADGPIGYWRLGEATVSAPAADASGHGNDGTYSTGGITLGHPGFHGGDTAALFDGTTGRIVVPNSATNNPPRITMEAKVRWDGPTGLQQRILEKESYAGTTQYGLSVNPDAKVRVELRMNDGSSTPHVVAADSTGVVALGAETHVVATYDGLAIRIYLNGILDSATPINTTAIDIDTKWPHTPPDDPEVALAIGDRMGMIPVGSTIHRTFYGLIDEVAIFATALSRKRILAHYQAQLPKNPVQDNGKDPPKDPPKDFHKDPPKDFHKDPPKDFHKDPPKDFHKDPPKDIPKDVFENHGFPHGGPGPVFGGGGGGGQPFVLGGAQGAHGAGGAGGGRADDAARAQLTEAYRHILSALGQLASAGLLDHAGHAMSQQLAAAYQQLTAGQN